MCEIAGVSRSGYYNYFYQKSQENRDRREKEDLILKENTLKEKAYLSTIKDSSTNEMLAYNVSDRLTLDLATDTLVELKKNRRVKFAEGAFIHSDQGVHYTGPTFQKHRKKLGLGQ